MAKKFSVWKFQGCVESISRVFQGCFREFPEGFKKVPRCLMKVQECAKEVIEVYGHFEGVSKNF